MFGSGFVQVKLRCFRVRLGALFSHALAGEIDAIGVVNEAIQDGIGQRWVCDDFVPAIQGHLTGDDRRATLVAVFDDLEEIATHLGYQAGLTARSIGLRSTTDESEPLAS